MNHIAPHLTPDRPHLITLGGGKGGVGRSTLCAEVARSLARQGARVLCLDASWSCPSLYTFLHAEEPATLSPQTPTVGEPRAHIASFIQETGVKSVWLISLASARRFPYMRPNLQAELIIAQLHQLDFDLILIDLPPELDPLSVALFTLSDIPLLVCSPEPTAIRITTQFLRAALQHALGYHPDAAPCEEPLLKLLYQLPLRLDRDQLLSAADALGIGGLVDDTLQRFEVYLLVNLVREGAERDLGHMLSHAMHDELGIFPRFITSIDHEDRRWFYNRRVAAGPSSRGEEALSNDIERLVRHLNQIDALDQRLPRPLPTDPDAHPALRLGLAMDTSANQLRQHCRRLWEGYRRESTASFVFSHPERRAQMADAIEQLYKRSLSLPGEATSTTEPPPSSASRELLEEDGELARELGEAHPTPAPPPAPPSAKPSVAPERAPGRIVERLRRQHNLSLQDLSQRAHIGIKYLAAIEDTDLEVLPRAVYLRGYLREIARVFGVDSAQLIDEYFRLLEELTSAPLT